MALTIDTTGNPGNYPVSLENFGGQVGPIVKHWYGLVLGDTSYPTGGYPIVPATFGFTAIYAVIPATASNSNTVTWTGLGTSSVPGFLEFFVSTTGAQVASATNLSAVSVPLFIIGI